MLKFDGCYYKPYMIVNSWSIEDLPKPGTNYSNAAKKLLNKFEPELYDKMNNMFGGNKLDGFPHSRSMHYSYHPQTDIAFSFKTEHFKNIKHNHTNGVVLFEEFKAKKIKP